MLKSKVGNPRIASLEHLYLAEASVVVMTILNLASYQCYSLISLNFYD